MKEATQIKPILVVAIDGPAASGKSTIAKKLAERLHVTYINSGLMYRAITYKCLEKGLALPRDLSAIISLTASTAFHVGPTKMLIDGVDLSLHASELRVSRAVSLYSQQTAIRRILIKRQREIAQTQSVVMDGRDIGTVVFPRATYKFYLDASNEVRAKRRLTELQEQFPAQSFSFKEILSDQQIRDQSDRDRKVSPLKTAHDAIVIDTSSLTIDEAVEKLLSLINNPSEG